MSSKVPRSGFVLMGVAILCGMMLTMATILPAYAAVTISTKNPPYQNSSTARYSSTGVVTCNPAHSTPSFHARVCASAFTSNGQIDVKSEAGLWQVGAITQVQTWAQGRINNLGDLPNTNCLNNQWFKFSDDYYWDGSAYRSHFTHADGYLTHYFRVYKAADCNTWSGAFYKSFQGKIFQAGSPGTRTYFSGTVTEFTPTYGPETGKFSVRLEDTAVSIAANVANAYADANFWDGAPVYTQIQKIRSFSCTSSALECASAT